MDQALQQVAQQNNLTLTQLRQRIEVDGVDFAEFRRSIREEILSSRLRQRVVGGMEEISDTEIDILLASDRLGGAEYLLSQIVDRGSRIGQSGGYSGRPRNVLKMSAGAWMTILISPRRL